MSDRHKMLNHALGARGEAIHVRRNAVPLRVVAIGDIKLGSGSRVDLRFVANRTLPRMAHRNLAIVFAVIVVLRLFDMIHLQEMKSQSSLYDYLLMAVLFLLGVAAYALRQAQRAAFLIVVILLLLGMITSSSLWALMLAIVSVLIVLLAPDILILPRQWIERTSERQPEGLRRAQLQRLAYQMSRTRYSALATLLMYCAVCPVLFYAQHLFMRVGDAEAVYHYTQPALMTLALIVSLLLPWYECYCRAPGFGRMEREENGDVTLQSTAFARRVHGLDTGTLSITHSEAKRLLHYLPLSFEGEQKYGMETYERLSLQSLLDPHDTAHADRTDREKAAFEKSLARLFLRKEIENTPAVMTFAVVSCVMPGVVFLILCTIMKLATTMELTVAGVVWTLLALLQIYKVLRYLPFALRIDIEDEQVVEAPVLEDRAERDALNATLIKKCRDLITVSGGILLGVVVAVVLGLLGIDSARVDAREDCLLFEACGPKATPDKQQGKNQNASDDTDKADTTDTTSQ